MADEILDTSKVLVPPDMWNELTPNQLFEQKNILFDKWMFLVEQKYPYAKELEAAIAKIDAFIAKKNSASIFTS